MPDNADIRYLKKAYAFLRDLKDISGAGVAEAGKAKKFIAALYSGNFSLKNFSKEDYFLEFSLKIYRKNGRPMPAIRIMNRISYRPGLSWVRTHEEREKTMEFVLGSLGLLTQKNQKALNDLFQAAKGNDYFYPVQCAASFAESDDSFKLYQLFFMHGDKQPSNEERWVTVKNILEKENLYEDINFLRKREISLFSLDFKKNEKQVKIYLGCWLSSDFFWDELNRFRFDQETIRKMKEFCAKYKEHLFPKATLCYVLTNDSISIKKAEFFLKRTDKESWPQAGKIADFFLESFTGHRADKKLKKYLKKSYVYTAGKESATVYFYRIQ